VRQQFGALVIKVPIGAAECFTQNAGGRQIQLKRARRAIVGDALPARHKLWIYTS